ncbi:dmX-like protein 2 isoform X2 [Antedon mediterranea]|uniref:dmX-like protein 2 isoform X2 n=1 Tax=Antedon mediterranea TaxID=105859 RepID=UPI003AF60CFC
MNRHQVLTGAVNPGENCFAVGYVDGVPFTAYASGCDIVILDSNHAHVQVIPGANHGNIQVGCIDSSAENGKIAASYANQVYLFEPVPTENKGTSKILAYEWKQYGCFKLDSLASNLSWNQDGSKLLTGSDSIQLWACAMVIEKTPDSEATDGSPASGSESNGALWECIWQCKTSTPVYHLKFSPDGQYFASAGKADRLVKIWHRSRKATLNSTVANPVMECSDEKYSFVYIAHPRAITGFSWRKTSKYMPKGSVANILVTSCRDNICRIWCETLLPDLNLFEENSQRQTGNMFEIGRHHSNIKKPTFNISLKHRKRKKSNEQLHTNSGPLPSHDKGHEMHHFLQDNIQTNGHSILPVHFHIASTINPNTDIPLLPALSSMSGSKTPNFVVNWLNNKELQLTLVAETILQEKQNTNPGLQERVFKEQSSEESSSADEEETPTPPVDEDELNSKNNADSSGSSLPHISIERPSTLVPGGGQMKHVPSVAIFQSPVPVSNSLEDLQKRLDCLMRDWYKASDMLFAIHPVDGSFLLWLVDFLDETSPGTHRQAQVSFSCRIPLAFPVGDATTLCSNIVMYRSNLVVDPRANKRTVETPGMTPSYSFSQRLGQLPPGVNIYAFTPKVSMLSKHINGTLNQWEISFAETSKFQTVLSVSHKSRCCGHRFRLNDLQCHPILPLLLTTSHHNLPQVEVDPEIMQGHTRRGSMTARRTSLMRRSSSISLFGKSILSESEHTRLSALYNSTLEGASRDNFDSDEVVVPDALMEKLNSEMNWPDMSAPTGLCSELILWRVFPVGPLSKSGGVMELARINSPFLNAFSHIAWLPCLLPSSCLGLSSNSPSACFVASDGYTLRVFQSVIDARTLLAEVSPNSDQFEGYLSSSSPLSTVLNPDLIKNADGLNVISLQSTSRPGCIIELNKLNNAKQNWQNVQLMHAFQHQFICGNLHDTSPSYNLPQPNMFEEQFFLVVVERKMSGISVIHMWYIHLGTEVKKHTVNRGNTFEDDDDDDIPVLDSSSDSSRGNSPTNFKSIPQNPQSSTRMKIFSHKVCSQRLELPAGVEVISAAPAAGHLSSSSIYPSCCAPYLFSTACSDGKVRFWKCDVQEEGDPDQRFYEDSDFGQKTEAHRESSNPFVTAYYSWMEWVLETEDKTDSSVIIQGKPLAVSSAYNGRFACAYELQNSDKKLAVVIYESESSGGSEWLKEDSLYLSEVSTPEPKLNTDILTEGNNSYKTMKRSSKVSDFVELDNDFGLCGPSLRPRRAQTRSKQTKATPIQLAWVSKEDGSHMLTVGVGGKVLIYAKSFGCVQEDEDVRRFRSFSGDPSHPGVKPNISPSLLHKGIVKPTWQLFRTVKLSTVDGLPPLSKMLAWVRAGILVVGLENEMHVYSQWKTEDKHKAIEGNKIGTLSKNATSSYGMNLSVDIQTLPMSKTDREKSYADMTELANEESKLNMDLDNDKETVEMDCGLFETAYNASPVLPQYHPKQLMELLNCGKIRRVKAILAHLVRCIAGENELRKALMQGDDGESEKQSSKLMRQVSLATSPTEPVTLEEEKMKLDYIEINAIPPLPLYALIAVDSTDSSQTSKTKPESGSKRVSKSEESTDYSDLFSTPKLDEYDHSGWEETHQRDRANSISAKLRDPSHFEIAQARLLTNHLTHTRLPRLTSLDQMHLLALADTVASVKTEMTVGSTASAAIGKEGAGYASKGNTDSTHAGETLDECGVRFLLAMRFHTCLLKSLPLRQQFNLKCQGLATCHYAWAFHSEAEEELLDLIPSMQKGEPRWDELKAMGVAWWVRSTVTLRRTMEKVAKSQFQTNKDPLDAALFYLAMKKKTVVWGLYRSIKDARMTDFFAHNFNEDRWRKAALKNAYALLGKQRFNHAAAFFLLAGSLKDAIEVCCNNLGDIQLAIVITRLYEDEMQVSASYKKLLFEIVFGCDIEGNRIANKTVCPDPFLRSISYWVNKEYTLALETLLSDPKTAESNEPAIKGDHYDSPHGNPDVFNFYNYLRTHPLLIRRHLAGQDRPAAGASVLITGFGKGGGQIANQGDQVIEDEITPEERRLFFATAHAHSEAGCPLLALEVLTKLPKVKTKQEVIAKETESLVDSGNESISKDMITSGIFSGFSESELKRDGSKDSAIEFDWSQPVSNAPDKGGGSNMDFDWGAPSATDLEEELELKWDDDEEDNEDEEEVSKSTEPNLKNETKDDDAQSDGSTLSGSPSIDILAQQLKFKSCLKIMMEELRTLATGFEVEGGQLRYQLYQWLEREVEILRLLCNYTGDGLMIVDEDTVILSDTEDEPMDRSQALHEFIKAELVDFEARLLRAERRKSWLKKNHHLLRTLFSYATHYGLNGGGLTSVCMELVLLMQEVQQERKTHQQLTLRIPLPTTLPLLSASIANCKTVVADPIMFLRSLTHDVLQTILEFTAPPRQNKNTNKVKTLHRLCVALAACFYESLCDSETFSPAVSQTKSNGMDVYDGRNLNFVFRSGHLVCVSKRRRISEETAKIVSPPSKWPGVAQLQTLLAQEKDEDIPKAYIQLCEGLLAIYISLLVHALSTNNCNELYRLMAHNIDQNMWAAVFGGGARIPKHQQSMANAPNPNTGNNADKRRNSLYMRVLGKASRGRVPVTKTEEKLSYREKFVPPESSVIDFLMVKPYVKSIEEGIGYDSAESEASDDEDYYDDSATKASSTFDLGQKEHSDFNSYSWCLMRFVIVQLALDKMEKFLPVGGIELAELPVSSPLLHSILKLLEQWIQALEYKLDLFSAPPDDYIPDCMGVGIGSSSGPAILKYKAMLEPDNTPFLCEKREALPAKRLWNFLVRQDQTQETFIKYIFKKKQPSEQVDSTLGTYHQESGNREQRVKVRVIHKEPEKISAFCFNQADWKNITQNGMYKASASGTVVSTHKEILELDISMLLNQKSGVWADDEVDDMATPNLTRRNISTMNSSSLATVAEDEFLMVHHSTERSASIPNANTMGLSLLPGLLDGQNLQTGRGTNVISRRPTYHIRRLSSHPTLPYYISGSQDGSVSMWEWGHSQRIYMHRPPGQFPKVTQLHFNVQGNKFGVCDDSGQLCLWQVGMNSPSVTKPFLTLQCHNKTVSDFTFMGSCSLLATAGLSTENKNVSLWDTLMPKKKACIHGFSCHDGGCPSIAYCPNQQSLITGNKKGEVAIFDIRQRKLRHSFTAHDSGIKCIAVDPNEDFFLTGSAEGNIKVWGLSVHNLRYSLPGQHARNTFFRQTGSGVIQITVMSNSHIYSCGVDGTMKWIQMPGTL